LTTLNHLAIPANSTK